MYLEALKDVVLILNGLLVLSQCSTELVLVPTWLVLWYLITKSGAGHAHFICAEIAVDGYLIGLVSIQA